MAHHTAPVTISPSLFTPRPVLAQVAQRRITVTPSPSPSPSTLPRRRMPTPYSEMVNPGYNTPLHITPTYHLVTTPSPRQSTYISHAQQQQRHASCTHWYEAGDGSYTGEYIRMALQHHAAQQAPAVRINSKLEHSNNTENKIRSNMMMTPFLPII